MWELDHKEGWSSKSYCFLTVVLEKTLENPVDNKEIKPVNPKGNQSWVFIVMTDAEAEVPILCPPDVKSWLTGKRLWCWERLKAGEGMTEGEMVGWHHRLDGHGFEQALGDGKGQRRLACCSPWGHRVGHDWETEQQLIKVTCGCQEFFLLFFHHE